MLCTTAAAIATTAVAVTPVAVTTTATTAATTLPRKGENGIPFVELF